MNSRIVINGYTVPRFASGNAISWIVEEILRRPSKSITRSEALHEACLNAPLNESTASWLVTPGEKRSPIGSLFERFKGEKQLELRLLPNAEILNGTYVDPWKEAKHTILKNAEINGYIAGALVNVLFSNQVPYTDVGQIIALKEIRNNILFKILVSDTIFHFDYAQIKSKF